MAWYGNSKAHADAGRKGGKSQGKANNPGNFANDREKARRAGQKGGSASPHQKLNLPVSRPDQKLVHEEFRVAVR